MIERAIDAGVPLFNDGNPEACCAVYELAVTALLGLDGDLFSTRVRKQLRAALDSSESPREQGVDLAPGARRRERRDPHPSDEVDRPRKATR